MSRRTRDGTVKPVSRDYIFPGTNGDREKIMFPVQLTTTRITTYVVDSCSAIYDDHTNSISRATPIDSDYCRPPTASALSNKVDESRSNQF